MMMKVIDYSGFNYCILNSNTIIIWKKKDTGYKVLKVRVV